MTEPRFRSRALTGGRSRLRAGLASAIAATATALACAFVLGPGAVAGPGGVAATHAPASQQSTSEQSASPHAAVHHLAAGRTAQPTGAITVSAAASLMDVFPVIGRAFEKRYPRTQVTFNFAGSSTLVAQVIAGAPVDVLATASEATMGTARAAGAVNQPQPFARNTMTIAVPPANPARIRALADLARPGVLVGVCDVAVPCGVAARDVLSRSRLTLTPVTRELDVRALLGKVMAGELDAGIVYVTDVRAVGPTRVGSVSIPASVNVWTAYPIATVGRTPNPVTAQAFVDYVQRSPSAQGLLRVYGFRPSW